MALTKFGLETLLTMDGGRIGKSLLTAIHRAELDCRDRPAERKPRKVMMQISLVPTFEMVEGFPSLDTIDVSVQFKEANPVRFTRSYSTKPLARGGLAYNDLSRSDVNQMTLDEADGRPATPDPS